MGEHVAFYLKTLPFPHPAINGIEQFDIIKRLYQIVVCSHLHCLAHIRAFRLGGQKDEGDIHGILKLIEHIQYPVAVRSEEHTSELQSRENLVCRLLLEK